MQETHLQYILQKEKRKKERSSMLPEWGGLHMLANIAWICLDQVDNMHTKLVHNHLFISLKF